MTTRWPASLLLASLGACAPAGSGPGAPSAAPSPTPPPVLAGDFTPPTGPDLSAEREAPGRFRIVLATSADGRQFATTGRVLSEQANTPDFVRTDDGRLLLYYTGGVAGRFRNVIAAAVSADDGQTWTFRHVTVSGLPGAFGDPDVVRLDDGRLRMFVTTRDGGRIVIRGTDGTDGLLFAAGPVAASAPGDDVLDSTTFRLGNTWHQYAFNPRNDVHWHFTSADALRFTLLETLQVSVEGRPGFFAANGIDTGAGFRLFVFSPPDRHIRSVLGSDGSRWTGEDGMRLAFAPSALDRAYFKDPSVVRRRDGTWLMAYVTRADE